MGSLERKPAVKHEHTGLIQVSDWILLDHLLELVDEILNF